MTSEVTVAIISTSGAVIVGLGALATNALWIGKSFDGLGKRIDALEHRLGVVEQDLKQFYRDIVQIKQKIGLE